MTWNVGSTANHTWRGKTSWISILSHLSTFLLSKVLTIYLGGPLHAGAVYGFAWRARQVVGRQAGRWWWRVWRITCRILNSTGNSIYHTIYDMTYYIHHIKIWIYTDMNMHYIIYIYIYIPNILSLQWISIDPHHGFGWLTSHLLWTGLDIVDKSTGCYDPKNHPRDSKRLRWLRWLRVQSKKQTQRRHKWKCNEILSCNIFGKSRKIMENHGISPKITENYGKSYPTLLVLVGKSMGKSHGILLGTVETTRQSWICRRWIYQAFARWLVGWEKSLCGGLPPEN